MQDFERTVDPRLLPGGEIAEAYLAQMQARCAAHGGVILVAEEEGKVVGFVGLLTRVEEEELDQPPEPHALVSDLSVTESARGRGIGRALLRAAEARARRAGARELRIGALTGNTAAEELYRTEGFRPWLVLLSKSLTDAPSD